MPYSATDQTVTAEVYVQDTDNSSPEIGDQQVEIALPSSSDVSFTSAGATTDDPYLFAPQSPATVVDSSVVYGTDYPYAISPPTLNDGDGLLLLQITIKAGTTGDFPLTFATDLASDARATALFNQLNQPIPFSVQNGLIDIGPSPVPEPSSIVLALMALAAIGAVLLRRKRFVGVHASACGVHAEA